MNEVNALDKEIQATTTRLINARCRRPLFGIESVKVTSSPRTRPCQPVAAT